MLINLVSMTFLISVIIPTYKPQSYLWECLDSLCAQTLPPESFEVILVLNGCCEPYKSQIEKYVLEHNMANLRLIQTDQAGVSNARNIGLDKARGDYIAFIDDDDYVSPSYLEELYKQAFPRTISLCYPYAFNDGIPDKQLPYNITEAYEYCIRTGRLCLTSRMRKYFSGPCMKLIPMTFIRDRRFDTRFNIGEDTLFMFLISDSFHSFAVTSRAAIYYRRFRHGSATYSSKSFCALFRNNILQMCMYVKYYMQNPFQYSTLFFLIRISGNVYTILKSGLFKSLSIHDR